MPTDNKTVFQITLILASDEREYGNPARWDWHSLLDVTPDELIAVSVAPYNPS
jgi:hypothetical protein